MLQKKSKMMLQKNNARVVAGALALLLLGAGCSNATDTVVQQPEQTPVVVTKPPGTDTIDYAIDACESRGFEAVLRYDANTKNTSTYCDFGNGYACEAVAYITGSCTANSTNRIYLAMTDGVPDNIRTCTNEETPVCANNGITYTNSCIASLQQVDIAHVGVCTEAEQEAAFPSTPTGGNTGGAGSSSGSGSNTGGSSGSQNGAWVLYLSAIANKSANPTQEVCTYGSTKVYYTVESCPDCFSTLYNASGQVICHPHNDIANECPSYFNKDSRGANCKRI